MSVAQLRATDYERRHIAAKLFQFLEDNAIPYLVVGDTRRYATKIDSDIDIIVAEDGLRTIPHRLLEFCRQADIKLVQCLQHESTARYFVFTWRRETNRLHFLHPDICSDYYRNGRLFLTSAEMLQNAVRTAEGFFVPEPAKAFIYYLLKKVDKKHLDRRQFDYLRHEWSKDPVGAEQQVRRFWPGSDAKTIIDAFRDDAFEAISTRLSTLQRSLDKQLPFSLRAWVREAMRKVKRILQPTGVFVVFLGADGSGKSTVIEQVEKNLAPALRRTKRYHLRPRFGASRGQGVPVTNPHGKPGRSSLASLAKLGLWWGDYVFSYLSDMYWRLVRSTFVIFDRYYDDILVDPKRYRYGGSMALARAVRRLIPKPDIVILLDAPAAVLQSRKQEVPLEETARQREAYLKLVQGLPNGHVVDASQPLEAVIAEVEDIILNYMAKRTAKRLGLVEQ